MLKTDRENMRFKTAVSCSAEFLKISISSDYPSACTSFPSSLKNCILLLSMYLCLDLQNNQKR